MQDKLTETTMASETEATTQYAPYEDTRRIVHVKQPLFQTAQTAHRVITIANQTIPIDPTIEFWRLKHITSDYLSIYPEISRIFKAYRLQNTPDQKQTFSEDPLLRSKMFHLEAALLWQIDPACLFSLPEGASHFYLLFSK